MGRGRHSPSARRLGSRPWVQAAGGQSRDECRKLRTPHGTQGGICLSKHLDFSQPRQREVGSVGMSGDQLCRSVQARPIQALLGIQRVLLRLRGTLVGLGPFGQGVVSLLGL